MKNLERSHLKNTEPLKVLIESKFNPIKEELCDKLKIEKSVPLVLLQFAKYKSHGRLSHIFYDAVRDDNRELYLEPKKISLNLIGIYKFIKNFNIENVTPELFVKLAEIILTHQLFHMHLFNKDNIKKYRDKITGKINVGTLETEQDCFTMVKDYYSKNGDVVALLLLEPLWLVYKYDFGQISKERFKYEAKLSKFAFIEASEKLVKEKYLE
jgi:hypothetical protein